MEFYSALDYRRAIKYLVDKEKALGLDVNFSKLAEAIRVQRPYLSKVMNGSADLNSDQLYLLSQFFQLKEEEAEYLELLLEYSRAQLKEKKDHLKRKIQKIQALHLDIKKHVDAKNITPEDNHFSDYYLNHYMQVIHVALNIRRYQDPEKLALALNISKAFVLSILQKLEELSLVEFKNGKYKVTSRSIHLPKDSSLIKPHQALVRLRSLEQFQVKSHDPGNYSFSVTFSGDEQIRKRIQEEFLAFLKTSQKIVASGGTEEVYQMNFDLFSWTQ